MSNSDKIKAFTEAVKRHDVTFDYSDDHSVWLRGSAERAELRRMAAELPEGVAAEIWKSHMDKYFTAEEAPRWYGIIK